MKNSCSLTPVLDNWLREELGQYKLLRKLEGGKNNQAILISSNKEVKVLKLYFNEHSRCETEIKFFKTLEQEKIPNFPRLLASNTSLNAAILTYVEGALPQEADHNLVMFTAEWIGKINQPSVHRQAEQNRIQAARGALTSAHEFAQEMLERAQRFSLDTAVDEADVKFDTFYRNKLSPVIQHLATQIEALSWKNDVLPTCLSPSDIGFHNILIGEQTHFLDFEYAGWDSIDKLFNDFFAQPRYPINKAWMTDFAAKAFVGFDIAALLQRSELLLPATHVKWVLIFLNDFSEEERIRREFSSDNYEKEATKINQLKKAQNRLSAVMDMI